MSGMPKPAVAVLIVLLLALVPCAALTEAGGPDRGAAPGPAAPASRPGTDTP